MEVKSTWEGLKLDGRTLSEESRRFAPDTEMEDGTGRFKCDGTRTETIFRLSAKRTCPFKSAGASVQSTTGR